MFVLEKPVAVKRSPNMNISDNNSDFWCHVCASKYASKRDFDRHLGTEKHRINLTNQENMPAAMEEKRSRLQISEVTPDPLQRPSSDAPKAQEYEFSCKMCNYETNRKNNMMSHLKSDRHVMNELDRISSPSLIVPSEAKSLHDSIPSPLRPQRQKVPLSEKSVTEIKKTKPELRVVKAADAFNPRSVRSKHSLIDYESWPKLKIVVEKLDTSFLENDVPRCDPQLAAASPEIGIQPRERKMSPNVAKALLSQNHACKHCSESFRLKSMLNRHFLKSHYTGDIFECDCGAVFTKKEYLKKHKFLHHTEQARDCEACGENLLNGSRLYDHWQSKHFKTHGKRSVWMQSRGIPVLKKKSDKIKPAGTPVFKEKSDKIISTRISLLKKKCEKFKSGDRSSLRTALHHQGGYTCDVCGAICNSRASINVHLKYQHFVKNFLLCHLCPKSFNLKSLFERHLERNHSLRPEAPGAKELEIPKSVRQSIEPRTALVTVSSEAPTGSEAEVTGGPASKRKSKSGGSKSCVYCGESCQSHSQLRNHMYRDHYPGKLHECHCGNVFKSREKLNDHKRWVHADKFDCELCGQTLKCFKYMNKHWRSKHLAEHGSYATWKATKGNVAATKPSAEDQDEPQVTTTCPCCYKTFDVKALDQHIEKTHRKGTFQCQKCDEKFSYHEPLRLHDLKNHYKGELHECRCGSVYKTEDDLNQHEEAHLPPVTCEVCIRFFEDKESLDLHWKDCHFETHGAYDDWKKSQPESQLKASPLLISEIQSSWDGMDYDFDGETYCSDDDLMYEIESEDDEGYVKSE